MWFKIWMPPCPEAKASDVDIELDKSNPHHSPREAARLFAARAFYKDRTVEASEVHLRGEYGGLYKFEVEPETTIAVHVQEI